MQNFHEIFLKHAAECGISIEADKIEKFYNYYLLLIEWNQKFNLTAITDMTEVIIKHFIDSLLVLKTFPEVNGKILLDLGTGAGFPGVPLKIAQPSLKVILVDSLRKRIDFLNHLSKELKLDQIEAVHARAEELGKSDEYRQKFDIVVSRAVAKLSILSEYCLPFVKVGGKFIALKGPGVQTEITESGSALQELGGKIVNNYEYQLPVTGDSRYILVINKTKETPTKYPRKAGLPEKRPL